MKISNYQLYVILDKKCQRGKSFLEVAQSAIAGGADIIQLRDKDISAKELIREGLVLRKLTYDEQVLLIVNDRVDIAVALDADGVHLGQEDIPVPVARRMLGNHKLIGKSTHSLRQALEAEDEGADYIGVGPIFATPTKPSYTPVGVQLIEEVSQRIRVPFVAIGGIDQTNIHEALKRGATNVAVLRAVAGAEDIKQMAHKLKQILLEYQRD